uniref:Uncharacterized protein n=1 Tax=Glyptapanteles indiensis TaxID=92994 RepID=B7S928_GLYIN|nr:hypothetical protein GIP_L8_0170 [Glyptapanteles indiensis]
MVDLFFTGPGTEQRQNRKSSTSTIIDFEQGKVANSRPSEQSEKTPKNKENTISKLINRLSLSKKQLDESNQPYTPDPEEQESSKKESLTTTYVTIFYAPIAQLALSSECDCDVPQTSSTALYDEPPDQSLLAK